MKKAGLIYQIVVGVCIVVLFYLHFSGSNQSSIGAGMSTDSTGAKVISDDVYTVYVNGDSLLNNYDYFKKSKKDFEARTSRTENEIIARRTLLEKELNQYQQTAGSMTNEQRARAEEALMRKEQDLRTYSEKAAMKLQEDQDKFNEALFDKVSEYLKGYTKDKKYKIVLNYTKGTGILFANDSLNITEDVLKGLNEEYAKSSK